MKFTLVITGAPYATQAPLSAWRFAKAALENGHQVFRVFLHGDGVFCATRLAAPAQDEQDIHRLWQELATQHRLDIVVCIASALKRGILNADESIRYSKEHYNLAPAMELSGLGQLIDAVHHSDRVITFGS
jgi:tRNA 2-thiouridine synthesizing protein D